MSALATTFADLRAALSPRAVPTVADFFAWEARQTPRLYQHVVWSLSVWGIHFDPSDPLSKLRESLRNQRTRDRSKAEKGHWSFNANRLYGVTFLLDLIDRFTKGA